MRVETLTGIFVMEGASLFLPRTLHKRWLAFRGARDLAGAAAGAGRSVNPQAHSLWEALGSSSEGNLVRDLVRRGLCWEGRRARLER